MTHACHSPRPGLLAAVLLVAVLVPLLVAGGTAASPDPTSPRQSPATARAFDHRLHVEEEGLDCTMCHVGAEDADRPGMPGLGTCRLCHEEPDAEAGPDELPRDPVAEVFDADGRYVAPLLGALPEGVVFSHLAHVEADLDCAACHGDVAASTAVDRSVAPRMADCVACHVDAGRPADCATCHVDTARALFGLHCEVCHGTQGRGDGPAAHLLEPAARDFGSGRFRIVSTGNGVPALDDLVATIRRGMPGSSMPPADWLSDEELAGLARHVRGLAVDGLVADLLAWAAEMEDELTEAEARAIAEERMTPGEPIEIVPPAPRDAATLERGRRLYLAGCASCHGEDGKGSGAVSLAGHLVNEDGTPSAARDFTAGILKGGGTRADLVRRIVAGLPGSPMPATSLRDPEDVAALVAFVQSTIELGAEERVRQRRRTIAVARAAGELPSEPSDVAWSAAEEVRLALAPLAWRDERVEAVLVRALHDGERIAVLVSWRDASRDDAEPGAGGAADAVSIAVTPERDPALFFAGLTGRPVDVALWRAGPGGGARTYRVLAGGRRGAAGDEPGAWRPAALSERSERDPAPLSHALERVMPEGAGPTWTARGTRSGDAWSVVLSRSLSGEPESDLALAPGSSASAAFAAWDGTHGDLGGGKSFSVWHRLELAP